MLGKRGEKSSFCCVGTSREGTRGKRGARQEKVRRGREKGVCRGKKKGGEGKNGRKGKSRGVTKLFKCFYPVCFPLRLSHEAPLLLPVSVSRFFFSYSFYIDRQIIDLSVDHKRYCLPKDEFFKV